MAGAFAEKFTFHRLNEIDISNLGQMETTAQLLTCFSQVDYCNNSGRQHFFSPPFSHRLLSKHIYPLRMLIQPRGAKDMAAVLLCAAALVCLLWQGWNEFNEVQTGDLRLPPWTFDPGKYQSTGLGSSDSTARDIQNRTLGFQEVYVISLPDRSDRRDAFANQAAVSNISYQVVDGVDGEHVHEKARPPV